MTICFTSAGSPRGFLLVELATGILAAVDLVGEWSTVRIDLSLDPLLTYSLLSGALDAANFE
jgi:hypothetical protein